MKKKTGLFYGWILVAAFWFIYLVNLGFPLYGAVVANAHMGEVLGIGGSTLGLGFTVFNLSQGLPGFLIAHLIDTKGIRCTLLVGSLTIVVGALLMALIVDAAWQYVMVYGVVIGVGVGFGTVLPIMTGVTTWFHEKRALAISVVLTGGGVGGFVAAPLIDALISMTHGNWQVGWMFIAGASILAAVVTFFFVRDYNADRDSVTGSDETLEALEVALSEPAVRYNKDWKASDFLKVPALWFFSAGAIGFAAPYLLCVSQGTMHLKELGISPSMTTVSVSLLAASSMLGRLLAGFLGDRIDPRRIWSVALLMILAGCLVIINASNLVSVALYAILVGTGFGAAYVSRLAAIGNYFGASAFASINGLLSPILTIFNSLTPFVGGLIYDVLGSYAIAFIGVSVISGCGTVCLLMIKQPVYNQSQADVCERESE